jgi:ribosome-associated translation inhibitor RaiA
MTHVYSGITSRVHVHGAVSGDARDYAVTKLEAALRHAPRRIVSSRLTIDAAAPGNRVDAHVNVNGVHVHVHAVGDTLTEATDRMQQRLRSCLRHIRRRPAQGPPAPEQVVGPAEAVPETPDR